MIVTMNVIAMGAWCWWWCWWLMPTLFQRGKDNKKLGGTSEKWVLGEGPRRWVCLWYWCLGGDFSACFWLSEIEPFERWHDLPAIFAGHEVSVEGWLHQQFKQPVAKNGLCNLHQLLWHKIYWHRDANVPRCFIDIVSVTFEFPLSLFIRPWWAIISPWSWWLDRFTDWSLHVESLHRHCGFHFRC